MLYEQMLVFGSVGLWRSWRKDFVPLAISLIPCQSPRPTSRLPCIDHLLLEGPAGSGKTQLAYAIALAGRHHHRAPAVLSGPVSQFTMSLVGFDHVFASAQANSICARSHPEGDLSYCLMLLKIVAFMDDQRRRVKDLDDIRGLLVQYEAGSDRVFSDVVIDAALQDYGLAPAFLLGLDLRGLCTDEEMVIVRGFLDAMDEANPAWMSFVRARGVGDHIEEDARGQLDTFRRGFDNNI